MRRPLPLAAYLALARRNVREIKEDFPPRPEGELIWLHVPDTARLAATLHLAARLDAHRAGLEFVLTTALPHAPAKRLRPNVRWSPTPGEHPADIEAFLAHWRPDACLWSHGRLRPALIHFADKAGLPLILVDAAEAGFDEGSLRWVPDLGRGILGRFTAVHASSANTARKLKKLGVREGDLRLAGPLQESSAPPDCDEDMLEEMTATLGGRPVWLAAMAQPEEMPILVEAHRQAQRLAHRLMLIVVPDDIADAPRFRRELDRIGTPYVRWSEGERPEESTQVLLADTHGEIGLWYRLAPVTLMGSSLVDDFDGRNPYEPAALGSAILHGPHVARNAEAYARLAAAGATRKVRDARTLATTLTRLIAPDQAAVMAHAAWEVVSEGAEVTDMVTDLVLDILDMAEAV